jgi:hypothetical protein
VVPDGKWPTMWRVRMRDGCLTDMVNLTRAKDAAIAYARPRGLGSSEIVRWDRRETPSEAPPCAKRWTRHEFLSLPVKPLEANDERF